MTLVLDTEGLGKRYGRHQALADCTLKIPTGRVIGLVGPNGAGKSTLLGLTSGLVKPTEGTIRVLGEAPAADASQLARVGFVAQDTPVYAGLSITEHMRLGAKLNPRWDGALAERRIRQLGLNPSQKAGSLSGGQRAQLALALAAGKRPDLLIFDEPVAALDPLARHGFLQSLMESVAELSASVILSSHLLEDLERVCDHLIVLSAGRVQVSGDVDDLVAKHYRLIGSHGSFAGLPPELEVIRDESNGHQQTLVVRAQGALPYSFKDAQHLSVEDLVLAYMGRADRSIASMPAHHTVEAFR
ncbi:ABC transporter ATP-binding protein [Micromonospora robiginosa]|uniref:ABC transporter ATP-binding protein n=1 Tax=Micromonospora robiginosa TaxID=2749844 RepID=A0A7L6B410_9ACTN|nr:ABC transporter ATP-binding protein [Micromonospora ferruginea]QLQ36505.1 ABC transporter ATP-binding protein [Micromonospora ferruginea]